ncbi:uncharacterized protein Dvir_GJ26162 [Drosophila virilis]|uniref:Uncharacterized protein n=1 Tax=Drosophila virilis TaxID=7244 RepID=A0A0Q9WKT3_DROVI|nr:uncharacterized protein Dvir_GJ26162 [Drosophila virilis]
MKFYTQPDTLLTQPLTRPPVSMERTTIRGKRQGQLTSTLTPECYLIPPEVLGVVGIGGKTLFTARL